MEAWNLLKFHNKYIQTTKRRRRTTLVSLGSAITKKNSNISKIIPANNKWNLQELKKGEKESKGKREKDWKWNNCKDMTILEEIQINLWQFLGPGYHPINSNQELTTSIQGSNKLNNYKKKLKVDMLRQVQAKFCKKRAKISTKIWWLIHIKKIAIYKNFCTIKIKII